MLYSIHVKVYKGDARRTLYCVCMYVSVWKSTYMLMLSRVMLSTITRTNYFENFLFSRVCVYTLKIHSYTDWWSRTLITSLCRWRSEYRRKTFNVNTGMCTLLSRQILLLANSINMSFRRKWQCSNEHTLFLLEDYD